MNRVLDAFAMLLLVGAGLAFAYGIRALDVRDDVRSVYLLLVGALALRASTEILRPRGGSA